MSSAVRSKQRLWLSDTIHPARRQLLAVLGPTIHLANNSQFHNQKAEELKAKPKQYNLHLLVLKIHVSSPHHSRVKGSEKICPFVLTPACQPVWSLVGVAHKLYSYATYCTACMTDEGA